MSHPSAHPTAHPSHPSAPSTTTTTTTQPSTFFHPATTTTQPSTSHPSTCTTTPPYELIYWPSIPGRAEFIRLCFEEAGVPYIDTALTRSALSELDIAVIPHVLDPDPSNPQNTDSSSSSNPSSTSSSHPSPPPPPFAPPILRHGDLILSQTPAILLYLAPRLGLGLGPALAEGESPAGPTGSAGEGPSQSSTSNANANAIYIIHALALTALDGLSNEPHDTHHPIASGEFYEAQRDAALRRARDYREVRLPKFLAYFERVIASNTRPSTPHQSTPPQTSGSGPGGEEWLHGPRITYADLVLAQALRGVEHAFPRAVRRLRATKKYERVFALGDKVWERERIKRYVESGKRREFGGGVYRWYRELDEGEE